MLREIFLDRCMKCLYNFFTDLSHDDGNVECMHKATTHPAYCFNWRSLHECFCLYSTLTFILNPFIYEIWTIIWREILVWFSCVVSVLWFLQLSHTISPQVISAQFIFYFQFSIFRPPAFRIRSNPSQ